MIKLELLFDYDSENPQLILRFEDIDDLIAFLVGFWEMFSDE